MKNIRIIAIGCGCALVALAADESMRTSRAVRIADLEGKQKE